MEDKKKEETQEKLGEKIELKIDGNLIVSPRNTRKLYGKKKLYPDEIPEGKTEEVNASLPDEVDAIDENLFPSAP